jgi:predicted dehydrogenase
LVERIRVGVVGAGANTRALHIPNLQKIAGVEIAAVCNRSRESSTKVAAEFNIAGVAEVWEQVVADPNIDAVMIGTWPDTHADISCAALSAGKHVLCEARMARNLAEARRKLAQSDAVPRLVAQVVPAPLSFRVDRTIARLVRQGVLGDILAIEVRSTSGGFIEAAAPLHWRSDFERSGLNAMSIGIWYETLMRWVGEATRVSATRRVFVRERRNPQTGSMVSIHIPDHVDIIADMACGAVANMRFSSVTGLGGEKSGAWIFGSDGTLHVDLSSNKLFFGVRGADEPEELAIAARDEGRWQVEEDFVASIRDGAPVRLTSFVDGVRYMAFTEAVALSDEIGRRVEIGPIL